MLALSLSTSEMHRFCRASRVWLTRAFCMAAGFLEVLARNYGRTPNIDKICLSSGSIQQW